MQLVSLNLWGGKIFKPLLDFLKHQSSQIDIFCFQEILFGTQPGFTPIHQARINLYFEIVKVLPEFESVIYHAPPGAYFQSEPLYGNTRPGQAIFFRKNLKLVDGGGFRGYDQPLPEDVPKVTGSFFCAEFLDSSKKFLVINVHGLWQGRTHKADTPARLKQSQILKDFIVSKNLPTVVCGDFNLSPNTQSLAMVAEGMRDLIKESGVTSTRTSFYDRPIKYADYIFVTSDIQVNDFKVLQEEVSDHKPLWLDFSHVSMKS